MPFPWLAIGAGALSSAIGGAIGIGAKGIEQNMDFKQQQKLMELQASKNKELADFNFQKQMEMWEKTNYSAQKEQLKKAGLNPGLMYGMSGGGGATTNAAQAQGVSGGANSGSGNIMAMALGTQKMYQEAKLLEAQVKNIEADTKNKESQNPNIEADTDIKVLQAEGQVFENMIKKYTGLESSQQYKIKQEWRSVESKTYGDELGARQAVATNIYELWAEGKLKEKSYEEIEQLLQANAKTRDERRRIEQEIDNLKAILKGVNLDNVMKEMDVELQKKTGLGKDSPALIKAGARFILKILGLD